MTNPVAVAVHFQENKISCWEWTFIMWPGVWDRHNAWSISMYRIAICRIHDLVNHWDCGIHDLVNHWDEWYYMVLRMVGHTMLPTEGNALYELSLSWLRWIIPVSVMQGTGVTQQMTTEPFMHRSSHWMSNLLEKPPTFRLVKIALTYA